MINQEITNHFTATFHPSQALSDIQPGDYSYTTALPCLCVRTSFVRVRSKKNFMSFVSLANSALQSFSTGIIVGSMIVITKNLKRKQSLMYVRFKASRLELASILNGGRDSLGSLRTHRFFRMIAADVVWHPNYSFALLARMRFLRSH